MSYPAVERLRSFCRALVLLWLLAALGFLCFSGELSFAAVAASLLIAMPVSLCVLLALRFVGFAFPAVWRALNRPVDPRALALLTPAGFFGGAVREIRSQARNRDR